MTSAPAERNQERPPLPPAAEAIALTGIRILGLVGIPFSLFLSLFLNLHAWQVSTACLVLMAGCIGLFFSQRWAAILVCGLAWFPVATYLFHPFPGDPRPVFSADEVVLTTVNGAVAVLLTTLPPLCSRRLKHGLWTRPASCPQAAGVAVLAGIVWLGFHLHNLVGWESQQQAMLRIGVLVVTIGAALVALLWRQTRE